MPFGTQEDCGNGGIVGILMGVLQQFYPNNALNNYG
jgi:hypothetical protein